MILTLGDAVTGPVEAHVDGTGVPIIDAVIGETDTSGVVNQGGCIRLQVAHLGEFGVEWCWCSIFVLWKRAPNSVLAAEGMTIFMMAHKLRMVPLRISEFWSSLLR